MHIMYCITIFGKIEEEQEMSIVKSTVLQFYISEYSLQMQIHFTKRTRSYISHRYHRNFQTRYFGCSIILGVSMLWFYPCIWFIFTLAWKLFLLLRVCLNIILPSKLLSLHLLIKLWLLEIRWVKIGFLLGDFCSQKGLATSSERSALLISLNSISNRVFKHMSKHSGYIMFISRRCIADKRIWKRTKSIQEVCEVDWIMK